MQAVSELPTYTALRYVQPLREGGSLPAVVDTEGGLFVVKFRGAGQGAKALVAELIVGLAARTLGLPTPEIALIDVPPPFGRSEPDPEIQDLLRASHGINVGLRYLDGAFNFAVAPAGDLIAPDLAARIVWLDALMTNPDRTHRNPNLLIWQRRPWLIDHGAALYVHHDWSRADSARARSAFPRIREHVLLTLGGDLLAADAECAPLLNEAAMLDILRRVPDTLLMEPAGAPEFANADAARDRYAAYFRDRLAAPREFVGEAVAARERQLAEPPRQRSARR